MILRRAEKRRAEDLQIMAAAQLRAAMAPWSEEGQRKALEFIRSLGSGDDREKDAEEQIDGALQLFAQCGIPIKEID